MESGEAEPKRPRIEEEALRPTNDTKPAENVNVNRLNRMLAKSDKESSEVDEVDGEEEILEPEFVERLSSPKGDVVSVTNEKHFNIFAE